ncbi:transposase [Vibrio crassostreae]|uniref:DDE family transposase n=2 Tax=Vibrio crassostreae TaxID=246167 RepID=A0A4R2FTW4_9VIBR|nr:hypothetical protein [Vibrio crassostreae]ROO50292.1 hypothetical protein EDB58_11216 [Vibrio crassostreae]TCL18787.1 hypothetical protein EDB52_1176 [Vibrio crassostreae]TCN05112.1 hypothetical protein EDB35_119105 [Vibrio crassostreae]TCN92721.1 hypothetical protein EDB50_11069 [Vibrio crassostreae]
MNFISEKFTPSLRLNTLDRKWHLFHYKIDCLGCCSPRVALQYLVIDETGLRFMAKVNGKSKNKGRMARVESGDGAYDTRACHAVIKIKRAIAALSASKFFVNSDFFCHLSLFTESFHFGNTKIINLSANYFYVRFIFSIFFFFYIFHKYLKLNMN